MLSYRHAFHAGNHADVLKHIVLVELLTHLNQKDKPYSYIDTHAGAGLYALDHGFAAQNEESSTGIAKLWGRQDAPEPVARYLDLIKSFQQTAPQSKVLRYYPGSPLLAQRMARATDLLRLFEMHTTDFALLKKTMNANPSTVKTLCDHGDGFQGLKATLPPVSRRGLILIDPSYEIKNDYKEVIVALRDALARFATGIYMLWYPCLKRAEVTRMIQQFHKLPFARTLHVALTVKRPAIEGYGMFGSGVLIGNPPWTLNKRLSEVMPYLVRRLGQDDGAAFVLEEPFGKK
ncbi:MAG: 23S rRNA (adenine(2030)-N(6))-methyltransferase RlmJ [Burkholderiales bacterium]|jgi:23S rRNA (adenine2030-N6)-methyltransferase|nr:23S rRNA (adenine(2030)-N(6))-methyltransferase RlmJ [Burkholderiales bacterium]